MSEPMAGRTAEAVPDQDGSAQVRLETVDGVPTLVCAGPWRVTSLGGVDAKLRGFSQDQTPVDRLDMSRIEALDTAGAWLLHRVRREASIGRPLLPLDGARAEYAALMEAVARADREPPEGVREPPLAFALLAQIGEGTQSMGVAARNMLAFSGLILAAAARTLKDPRRLRLVSIVHHIEQTGLNAVPIISLINFLIGAVIAFMSSDILRDYGGEIFTVDLIAFSFLREFGVLLAAVMVAGRSGSAFTAEIGAMKGHEEDRRDARSRPRPCRDPRSATRHSAVDQPCRC